MLCRHQKSVIASLRDADVSIRRRALDLLFAMCNRTNAPDIVAELLRYLEARTCLRFRIYRAVLVHSPCCQGRPARSNV